MRLTQALKKPSIALIIIITLCLLTLALLAVCYYWTMDILEVSTKNLVDSSITTQKITTPEPSPDKDTPTFIPQNFDGAKMDFYHEKDLDGDGMKEIFGILHGPNIEQTNLSYLRLAAMSQAQMVENTRTLLTSLSQNPEVLANDTTRCTALLERVLKSAPDYRGFSP